MLAHVRVGFVAALVTLASIFSGSIAAPAAEKAFQRPELAQAAKSTLFLTSNASPLHLPRSPRG